MSTFLGKPPASIEAWIKGHPIPPQPIPEDLLTFTAVEKSSTIKLNKVGTPYDVSLEYRVDDGEWKTFTSGSTTINLNAGQKANLRSTIEDPEGTNTTPFSKAGYDYYYFSMTGKIAASGNIQYLLDKTGQRKSVADNCYSSMFSNCTSLTQAPELPATKLANNCYSSMFSNCTSLTQAPELPATTLITCSYYSMFEGCTKINDIYIPNLTEAEYNAQKAAKGTGILGIEDQATFHFKQ